MPIQQDWVVVVEQIDSPAPLPEDPATTLLTEMLFPAPMRCRRRRPRRRPWGPGKVSGARWCQTHRPKIPRGTPPTKTRRKKRKTLPPPNRGGEEKEGRPFRGGRRAQEGKDPPSGPLHHSRLQRRVATQGQAPAKS